MKPMVLCSSEPVQYAYIKSFSVPLVAIAFGGIFCIFQYFHHKSTDKNSIIAQNVILLMEVYTETSFFLYVSRYKIKNLSCMQMDLW